MHTPGPWYVEPGDSVVHVLAGGRLIADTSSKRYYERHDATDLANAHLIAAAPVLLAAAKKVLFDLQFRIDAASLSGNPVPVFDGIADLHDAIAQAQGETK